MIQRGEYGHGPRGCVARSGWSIGLDGTAPLQPGDTDRAVAQLDAEMEAIVDAMYRSMGVDPTTLRRPAIADEAWMQRVRAVKAKASQSPLWTFSEATVSPKYRLAR